MQLYFLFYVFIFLINQNDSDKIKLIPTEYLEAAKHIFLQEIDASPNVHKMSNERCEDFPRYDGGMEL